MHIEELEGGVLVSEELQSSTGDASGNAIVLWDAKRALIGAGARALFYPTLLYNVVRNKIQSEFRWWDRVDEHILLGAVPFPSDVLRLKDLGVSAVVTLNEPYETLVATSLYHACNIDHLVIPTRDYLFAPSLGDIWQAVDFIHRNASCGRTTYVHCKAGRGRSTTIVICYLMQHKNMLPDAAYAYVRSIRPRVLLASSQWQAVQEYYFHLKVKSTVTSSRNMCSLILKTPCFPTNQDIVAFDDGSVVVVTESDLDGYDQTCESDSGRSELWADLSVVYRVQIAGKSALARLSCLWFRCRKISGGASSCSIMADRLGRLNVDIHIY